MSQTVLEPVRMQHIAAFNFRIHSVGFVTLKNRKTFILLISGFCIWFYFISVWLVNGYCLWMYNCKCKEALNWMQEMAQTISDRHSLWKLRSFNFTFLPKFTSFLIPQVLVKLFIQSLSVCVPKCFSLDNSKYKAYL